MKKVKITKNERYAYPQPWKPQFVAKQGEVVELDDYMADFVVRLKGGHYQGDSMQSMQTHMPVLENKVIKPESKEPRLWTEIELKKLAKHGINALRKIADPLNVVGRGKNELIREILAAQSEQN